MRHLLSTTIALISLSACAVTPREEASTLARMPSLSDECGPDPYKAPAFTVKSGTYPGQGNGTTCIGEVEWTQREAWITDLHEYANCAARYACAQRGGEASPDGCTMPDEPQL